MAAVAGARGRERALLLYRSILKAHKKHLPPEMKQLGDVYVRSEFKLHKPVKQSKQLDEFFTSWQDYLGHILQTARVQESVSAGVLDPASSSNTTRAAAASFGKDMPAGLELTQEQQERLSNLQKEATRRD
jgi:Complex1_LYR-like